MTTDDLDLLPFSELVDSLQRRQGIAMVIGIYDLKAAADASPDTQIWGVLSHGDLPLRVALGQMIESHLRQLKEKRMAENLTDG